MSESLVPLAILKRVPVQNLCYEITEFDLRDNEPVVGNSFSYEWYCT